MAYRQQWILVEWVVVVVVFVDTDIVVDAVCLIGSVVDYNLMVDVVVVELVDQLVTVLEKMMKSYSNIGHLFHMKMDLVRMCLNRQLWTTLDPTRSYLNYNLLKLRLHCCCSGMKLVER
jgi:hypothetical protein